MSDTDDGSFYRHECDRLAEQLDEVEGETITDDEAHLLMRAKFLRQTVVNRNTGEAIGQRIRSTTELTTEEFNNYLELCSQWLAEMFGIEVPGPDVYRENS